MSAASGGIESDGTVSNAKLTPPQLPHGHVSRIGLLAGLTEPGAGRLVSIAAPAGYGKTTLLAEMAEVEPRPVGWLSLDASDNDPVTLLSGLATSFGRTQSFDATFGESMSSPGGSVLGRLGPRVADAVGAAGSPFVMVLDDVHEVSSMASRDVIDLVVDRVPPGSTVVVAGRTEPIGLPRWRVRTDVREIGVDELAFDHTEAARFMAAHGAAIPDATLRELHGRLEGWVAGLQLAMVVARRGSLDGFDGGDRFVADYLRSEVLDGLSPEDRDFLIRTSVLSDLNAPLCDALLESHDSARRLEALERANLFVIPLDRTRSHYRYHAAFRDLLLGELERREGPRARYQLHHRASEWYFAHGDPEEAVEHAQLCGDSMFTASLVARVAQDVNASGRLATVDRWLNQLGDEAISGYPPLAVLAGWAAALSGDEPRAGHWLDRLDGMSFEGEPTDGTTSFESSRAMLRAMTCRSGVERMLVDAGLALSVEPAWGAWRATAVGLYAEALLLRDDEGDRAAARAHLGEAIELSRSGENADTLVWCCGTRALLAMDRNEWAAARHDLAEALAVIDEVHMEEYLTSLIVYAAGARSALHEGDRKRAERLVAVAMRLRGLATPAVPFFAVRLRLVLARVQVAMGEPVAARHLLREIEDIRRQRPDLGALAGEIEQLRQLLATAPKTGGSPLTPGELRVLPYLQTHLTLEEIGERLFLSRNTVGSHAKAIYRKFGVSSRGAAVDAALAMGLIGAIELDITP